MRGARPFARASSLGGDSRSWLEEQFRSRVRDSGRRRVVPPALFGGARARSTPALAAYDSYVRPRARALGDLVDASQLPYGLPRNYGSPAVEAWRDLVEQLAGDNPVEFLLAWIGWESAGDPCSWTTMSEAGIFQLMPPDNITQAGTTMAMMHPVPPCAAGSGRPSSSRAALPDDVAYEQVRAGVQYVNYCRSYVDVMLDKYGYDWPKTDFGYWALVKMVHALPSAVAKVLQAGIDGNGSPVADWETIKGYALQAGVVSSTITRNAEMVGQLGQGGGSVLGVLGGSASIAVIGAVGIGLWYLLKRTKARR